MRWLVTPLMLGAHLLAIVCVSIAAWLGVWQYDAWQERRAAEAVDLTGETPRPLQDVIGPDDPFPGRDVGRPVTIEGHWLPEGTVLVTDRNQDGERGYWVVTPLTDGGPTDSAIPVVRGFTTDVDAVPPPPTGTGTVVGWLQPSEGSGGVDEDPTDAVLPQLRVADLVQRVDLDLYSGYAVAIEVGPGEDGLVSADLAELPPAGRFTALKNLLYALEWWVFAGFAGFVWWRFVRDSRPTAVSGVTAAAGAPGPDDEAASEDRVASRA